MIRVCRLFGLLALFSSTLIHAKQCDNYRYSDRIDPSQIWIDFSFLASDELEGRKTQTRGAKLTRDYLQKRFTQIGLESFSSHTHFLAPFTYQKDLTHIEGINVVGYLPGTRFSHRFLVVTAHYDHLGKRGRRVFNGADDNASGVAGLLSLATALSAEPPQHSVIFVATDAEEKGLYGAKAFVQNPPVDIETLEANLNLDMLSQHRGRNRLYVSGSRYYPQYQDAVDQAIDKVGLCLVSGHRLLQRGSLAARKQNWRQASDHAAFAKVGIPYLFIGVSDHVYYHSEHDTVDKTRPEFYYAAVDASLTVLRLMDNVDANR